MSSSLSQWVLFYPDTVYLYALIFNTYENVYMIQYQNLRLFSFIIMSTTSGKINILKFQSKLNHLVKDRCRVNNFELQIAWSEEIANQVASAF